MCRSYLDPNSKPDRSFMIFSTVNLIFVFPPVFICICMLCFVYVSCKNIYGFIYISCIFTPDSKHKVDYLSNYF